MNGDELTVIIGSTDSNMAVVGNLIQNILETGYGLDVTTGEFPLQILRRGIPTSAGSRYAITDLRYTLMEHQLTLPYSFTPGGFAYTQTFIRPAVPLSALYRELGVNISVIGAPNTGKTILLQAIRNSLFEQGVTSENIHTYNLDDDTPNLSSDELAEAITRLAGRKINIRYLRTRSGMLASDLDSLLNH